MHKSISFLGTVNSSVSTVRHVRSDLTRRYSDASSMQEGARAVRRASAVRRGAPRKYRKLIYRRFHKSSMFTDIPPVIWASTL